MLFYIEPAQSLWAVFLCIPNRGQLLMYAGDSTQNPFQRSMSDIEILQQLRTDQALLCGSDDHRTSRCDPEKSFSTATGVITH